MMDLTPSSISFHRFSVRPRCALSCPSFGMVLLRLSGHCLLTLFILHWNISFFVYTVNDYFSFIEFPPNLYSGHKGRGFALLMKMGEIREEANPYKLSPGSTPTQTLSLQAAPGVTLCGIRAVLGIIWGLAFRTDIHFSLSKTDLGTSRGIIGLAKRCLS